MAVALAQTRLEVATPSTNTRRYHSLTDSRSHLQALLAASVSSAHMTRFRLLCVMTGQIVRLKGVKKAAGLFRLMYTHTVLLPAAWEGVQPWPVLACH